MKIIHSFTMRVLAIMVSLLLLFCAVSTIAWYQSFTKEAVETAEEHMDTVIETDIVNITLQHKLVYKQIYAAMFSMVS